LTCWNVEQAVLPVGLHRRDPVAKTFPCKANVDVTANTITITAHGFVTGLKIPLTGTNLPGGLSATNYWAIVVDANTIKVATSLANAVAGTAVDITTQGTSVDATLTRRPALGSSTFACYGSNDNVNFVALTSMTVTITAAGTSLFRLGAPDYRYLQLRFTAPVAGALTISAIVNVRRRISSKKESHMEETTPIQTEGKRPTQNRLHDGAG
jgi:hypothetical protein